MAKKRPFAEQAKKGLANYSEDAKSLFEGAPIEVETVISHDPTPVKSENAEEKPAQSESAVSKKSTKINTASEPKKKEAGRPQGERTRHVSITVPERLWPDVENAALILKKGNVSKYLTQLIEKDIKENGKKYSEITRYLAEIHT